MELITVVVALLPFTLLSRAILKKELGPFIDPFGLDVLALAGAFGYLALLMFALGVLQLYRPEILWGTILLHYCLAFLLYGKRLFYALGKRGRALLVRWRDEPVFIKGLVLFGVLLLFFNILGAYVPQTSNDALYYHFAIPKLFIRHGGLFFYPYDYTSVWPFNMEMLFTLGMLLHNDTTANLFNIVAGAAFSLMFYNLIRLYLGHRHGIFWAVVFYSTPLVMTEAHNGFVDMGAGLFAIAGFYILLAALRKKNLSYRTAILSGVFFGFSAGSKLFGVILGFFALALSLCFFKPYRWKIVFCSCLIALFMGLVASPWHIRSVIHTGNPVYPAFYSVFGGKFWNDAMEKRWEAINNMSQSNLAPLGRSYKAFMAMPFLLHYPRLLGDLISHDEEEKEVFLQFRPRLGYLAFLFFPFGFLFLWKRKQYAREMAFSAFSSLFIFIGWFFYLQHSERYLVSILGPLYLFSAFGLKYIFAKLSSSWLRRVSIAACALWFAASLGFHSLFYIPKAYGIVHRKEYLRQYSHFYKSVEWVNSSLGPNKKIAILSDIEPYYFDIPYIQIGPAFRLFDYKDSRSLYDFLIKEEVTHIFATQDNEGSYLSPDICGNFMIYLFRSDAPNYQDELARIQSTYPMADLLSDPLKTKLVYDREEAKILGRTPLVLGEDPVHVKIYELNRD